MQNSGMSVAEFLQSAPISTRAKTAIRFYLFSNSEGRALVTVDDIRTAMSEDRLSSVPGVGAKTIAELREYLEHNTLSERVAALEQQVAEVQALLRRQQQ